MYTLYFDGASRGNPGKASYGGVIYTYDNTEFMTYCDVLPKGTTNNEAEYIALYKGMCIASTYCIRELRVYGDSTLVIQQMNEQWKVKHPSMKQWFDKCKMLERTFETITYEHVERKFNKRADALANSALDNS